MASQVEVVQQDFTAGIRRARARDNLGRSPGANLLWDCRDWIIGRLGTPLAKRGGWAYQGAALASAPARVRSIVDCPFNGGHMLLVVEQGGRVQRSTTPFSTWAVDATTVNVGDLKQNPIFFLDTVLYPSKDGVATLNQSNEVNVATYSSGTYKPQYLVGHKGRVTGIHKEFLVYGPPGAPNQAWDANSAYDLAQPGTGIASLGNILLVFYGGHLDRVIGNTPAGYGVSTDDISIEQFSGDVGCIDAYSILYWEGTVIWADKNGVWQTDGSTTPLDLTFQGNAKDLYVEFMRGYIDTATTRVSCGKFSDLLFVTMTNLSTHVHIDTLVCDLPRRAWYRMQNFPFSTYAENTVGNPETWGGVETVVGRVAKLSGVLLPTSANSADGDGTAVQPDFETAFFRTSQSDARIFGVWLGYEMDFLGVAATLVNQTVTYTAVQSGAEGNNISVSITMGTSLKVVVTDSAEAGDADLIAITTINGVSTTAQIVALINADSVASALVTASGGTPSAAVTLVATNLTGGSTTTASLLVDTSQDPKASPTFRSYKGVTAALVGKDRHGEESRGYHWRRVKVNAEGSGVAIRVRQSGQTATTAVHAIGIEQTPRQLYHQS